MKLRIQAYSDKGCIRDGNEAMLLICSDGLTDMVPDEEIERIMAEDLEPAMGLIERAFSKSDYSLTNY